MGKYMKKSNISGEVAVMGVSQSTLGVHTRAKTLALSRLQKITSTPGSAVSAGGGEGGDDDSDGRYLQLRSRRLEKPATKKPKDKERVSCSNANPNPRLTDANHEAATEGAGVEEASFGENMLESDERGKVKFLTTRETTPCSLIRCMETIITPGSTTRATKSAVRNRRIQNAAHRNILTAHEMEEFFAGAEKLQQKMFTEKYNYDLVNDIPLPGRYEWVELDY